jgi:hypothetical protein
MIKIGDKVFDKADPRHVGSVTHILNVFWASVRWEETGWISTVAIDKLESATR